MSFLSLEAPRVGRFFLEQPAVAKEEREAASQGWRLEDASEMTMRRELETAVPRDSVEAMLRDDAVLAEVLGQWRELMDRDDVELAANVDVILKFLWFCLYRRGQGVRDAVVATLDRLLLQMINNE